MIVPTGPIMSAFAEEITLLRDTDPGDPAVVTGVVSIDTLVQDQDLSYRQSWISVPAASPLAAAAVGDQVIARGRRYTVQLVRAETDAGWRRVVIA